MALMRAIGLMSGTSLDGIDLAVIETDGDAVVHTGAWASLDYTQSQKVTLRQALRDAVNLKDRNARAGNLELAEKLVTAAHVKIVQEFLVSRHMSTGDVDVIGFHGQTVLHRPEISLTVQLGDGQLLAQMLNIPVVFDLRAADVAAGGQGAPLVPVFHQSLVHAANISGPVAVLNLGGVGNLTYIDNQNMIAFDCGPANALIDDEMLLRFGQEYDEGGAVAAVGRVDAHALHTLMAHPYFIQCLPKSLDRQAFSRAPIAHLSGEDAVATLTAFTASAVAAAERLLPQAPLVWILCGGGALNTTLRTMVQARVGGAVTTAEHYGWSARLMEAQAWAYLAVRSLRGLPITFPQTTGVKFPLTGGVFANPRLC